MLICSTENRKKFNYTSGFQTILVHDSFDFGKKKENNNGFHTNNDNNKINKFTLFNPFSFNDDINV